MASSPPNLSISYIGIDPGTSGALALLTADSAAVFDMPVIVTKTAGKRRASIDQAGLLNLIRALASLGDCVAVLEKVGGMPRQVGAFNFGRGFGHLEMAFVATGVPVEYFAPGDWKARARLIKKDKSASRHLASELYPQLAPKFSRLSDDGRAEALLIAHFWRATAA